MAGVYGRSRKPTYFNGTTAVRLWKAEGMRKVWKLSRSKFLALFTRKIFVEYNACVRLGSMLGELPELESWSLLLRTRLKNVKPIPDLDETSVTRSQTRKNAIASFFYVNCLYFHRDTSPRAMGGRPGETKLCFV